MPERTSYPAAARQLLRDMLLDAAGELLSERRWPEVTMADVARAAGVSRQTLYNEFRSRDDFAQEFVLHEQARLITAVEATIRAHLDDPAEALTEAFNVFLTAAAEDPIIHRLAISYAMLPAGLATMTATSIATLLGPYIEQTFAAPSPA
jgi:AcrR family transcriptional regulator